VIELTERWINQSERLLKELDKLASTRTTDRLEPVTSMIHALNTLSRSVQGWRSWIQSISHMSKFTEDELREMKKGLIKQTRDFIKYDLEVTKKHKLKLPKITITGRRRKTQAARGMYA
jgi:hypothetical protein